MEPFTAGILLFTLIGVGCGIGIIVAALALRRLHHAAQSGTAPQGSQSAAHNRP